MKYIYGDVASFPILVVCPSGLIGMYTPDWPTASLHLVSLNWQIISMYLAGT